MTNDPTRKEMMRALQPFRRSMEAESGRGGWDMDREAAIYWFASMYHGGQWSNLYAVLSTSPYSPGRLASGPEPDSTEEMLFQVLIDTFARGIK